MTRASAAAITVGFRNSRRRSPSYRRSFPDLHFTIEDAVAEDERIAFRWIARGTHQGDFAGIAPTGKPITVTGITILRIVEGKIIDDRNETNNHTLTEQLVIGAVTLPAEVGGGGQIALRFKAGDPFLQGGDSAVDGLRAEDGSCQSFRG